MKRTAQVLKWLGIGVGLLLLGVGLLLWFALETQPGHSFLLRTALDQAEARIDGNIRVGAIRSEGLLRGFQLVDVAVVDLESRPLFQADSLRLGYSVRRLLQGDIVLRPIEIWRPRLVLETLSNQERGNLARIFRLDSGEDGEADPDQPRDDSGPEAGGLRVALDGTRLHDGSFVLRNPINGDPPERAIVAEVPGRDGLYREIRFDGIEARLGRVRLADPGEPGERFEIDALAFTGHLFDDPFRVSNLQGEFHREGTRLVATIDELELPGSQARGQLVLDWGDEDSAPRLELLADVDRLRFSDLHWLEPRIPQGEGSLVIAGEGPVDRGSWRATELDLRVGSSRVQGRLGLDLGDRLRFTATELVADGFDLALVEPWLQEPLPVGGVLDGRISLSGGFDALEVDAGLDWWPERQGSGGERLAPASIAADGTLLLEGEVPGVRGLVARIDSLPLMALDPILGESPLRGRATVEVSAGGRLETGIQLSADVVHRADAGQASRVLAAGTVQRDEQGVRLALDGGLDPLDLDGIGQLLGRELPASGTVSGSWRAHGRLTDLVVWTRLQTEGGSLAIDASGDVTDLARGYRVQASTSGFDLAVLLPDVPDPTELRGSLELDGRGLDLDTVEGVARVELTDTRSGHVLLDRFHVDLEAVDGRLLVNGLEVTSPMGSATGAGELGLASDAGVGRVALEWELPELRELRPILMGDTIIQVDTLTALELETLRFDGIDPDTLGAAEGRMLDGSARGELNLSGGIRALMVDGFAEFEALEWREGRVESGRMDAVAQLDSLALSHVEGTVQLSEWGWGVWTFQQGAAEARWGSGEGQVAFDVLREAGESYRADAGFRADSTGVDAELSELVLLMDSVEWRLEGTSRLRWADRRLEVDAFEMASAARPGSDAAPAPMSLSATGVLDLEGDSDFGLRTQGLELARLGRLARLDDPPTGLLDLDLQVWGPAASPEMEGEIQLQNLEVEGARLDRVAGTLAYADRTATARVNVDHDGQRLLIADGTYPVDLAFREVEERFPDRAVDVTLEIAALPAATPLAFVQGLEQVEGTLDGQIVLRGEPSDLRPSGALQLTGGALSLPDLGLSPREIEADFELSEDGLVAVSGRMRSQGLAEISGTVDLTELADPGFDLRIMASGFQATQRRDLEARVGGEITLTGRFQAPRVGGTVRVEQGVMFLEEIARSAEVVDLTDPAFFDVVDTTLVADRPAVEAAQNPFLNNLVVNVDLTLERDFWLRSREMNVEIGGDLIVTFDRPQREILLVGTLQAIRGNYVAFGRQFQVQDGVVEFVGTPGINPTLDIQAVHRLRRESQEPLNIIAAVEGPLQNLRISLESEAQPPIAQSDLISYLLFGRPSFALGSGEASVLEGAAGAGVSVGIGTLAGQLSSVVAQQIGLDYFSITQSQDSGLGVGAGGVGSAFADTQIEVGQYVAEELYLAMVLRPLGGLGSGQTQIPGARLEWRFTDTWTFEAFVEDRFGREGVYSFGDAGLQLSRIFGIEIYREWGY